MSFLGWKLLSNIQQVKFCTSSGADAVSFLCNNFHWVLDQREKAEKHHRERVYHQWIVIGARRWEGSLEKQGECFVSEKKEPSANFDLIGLWVPARPAKCTSHQSLQQYNTHLLVYWHLPTTYLPTLTTERMTDLLIRKLSPDWPTCAQCPQ